MQSNRWWVWGLAFEISLALALIYVPGVNGLFAMMAVGPAWLLLVPGGATVFVALDVVRRWIGRLRGRPAADVC